MARGTVDDLSDDMERWDARQHRHKLSPNCEVRLLVKGDASRA